MFLGFFFFVFFFSSCFGFLASSVCGYVDRLMQVKNRPFHKFTQTVLLYLCGFGASGHPKASRVGNAKKNKNEIK